jgi:hypothetical protein
LTGEKYLNLTDENAKEKLVNLALTCKKNGGVLTYLIHNDEILTKAKKKAYIEKLKEIL